MNNHVLIVWPGWAARDLWRWLMLVFGLLLVAHGLFSKSMRMRDSSTRYGLWKGKIVTKPWQVVLMRSIFVLIGVAVINFAFTFDPRR
jgi:hypothetical protein